MSTSLARLLSKRIAAESLGISRWIILQIKTGSPEGLRHPFLSTSPRTEPGGKDGEGVGPPIATVADLAAKGTSSLYPEATICVLLSSNLTVAVPGLTM